MRHEQDLQDHLLIVKAFERGAHYSPTEDSVFAMMTPVLSNIKSQSESFLQEMEVTQQALAMQGVAESEVEVEAFKKQELKSVSKEGYTSNAVPSIGSRGESTAFDPEAESSDGPTLVGEYLVPDNLKNVQVTKDKTIADIVNECIPCAIRPISPGEVWEKIKESVNSNLERNWLLYQQNLEHIKKLLDIFSPDNVLDYCPFLEFFSNFICVPDLRRMIALLMVMLSNIAFELTNLFDLIVQLIAPLLMPILNSIFGTLQQFILMIVEPVYCIIDSIKAFLGKLDYAQLYQTQSGGKIEIGPSGGYTNLDLRIGTETGPISSFLRSKLGDTSGQIPNLNWGVTRDIYAPVTAFAEATTEDERDALGFAEAELKLLEEEERTRVNLTTLEREQYKARIAELREEVKEARNELNYTEIQQAQQSLNTVRDGIRTVMDTILTYLYDAIEIVKGFFEFLGDEILAIINVVTGANNDGITALWNKSQIIQIIGFLRALIQGTLTKCDNEEGTTGNNGDPYNNLPGFTVVEDETGTITIQEPGDEITEAFQGLGNLVQYTKDPVLDSEIAKTVEEIQTPVRIVRKCSFQTTVEDAEKVNQWIAELNTQ